MRVVVVGGGIGGLSAAVMCAAAGASVTLLEASSALGGKAGEQTVDGVSFDTGPSVLTLVDQVDQVFQSAGTRLRDELELIADDQVFEYAWPDGTRLPVHFTPEATEQSVRDVLGPEAASDFSSFLARSRRTWEAVAPHFVVAESPTVWSLLRPGALSALPWLDGHRSMWRGICSGVRSRHLRDLFARYATYNGSDPRTAPATLNCIAWVELGLGTYGIQGGMHELVRALTRVAERLGVRIETDRPVEGIDARSGAVCAVRTSQGTTDCDAVIVNADVAHLAADLMTDPPKRLRSDAPASLSGWTAVVKTKRKPRPGHAVYFPHHYDQEFADLFDRDRPPEEPTVYACAQGVAHRRPGWTEHEPIFLMANAPPEPRDGRTGPFPETLGQRTIERAREAGWIDAHDAIVWQRSPTELGEHFPRSRGALYGWASNDVLAAFRRPPNRVPGIRGLYLASGSAHPGGGVPMVAQSGVLAARALLADLPSLS